MTRDADMHGGKDIKRQQMIAVVLSKVRHHLTKFETTREQLMSDTIPAR